MGVKREVNFQDFVLGDIDTMGNKVWRWHGGWGWGGDVGAVGKRRARRFEWWWLEGDSGSIGRVMGVRWRSGKIWVFYLGY
jgi:hypothetical protein